MFASEIGKSVNDIINGGFCYDNKIGISTKANGISFSASGVQKDDAVSASISTAYKLTDNITADVAYNDKGKVNTTVNIDGLADGFKAKVSGNLPDMATTAKVALQFKRDTMAWDATIGAGASPKVDTSLCMAAAGVNFGAAVSFDAGKGALTKYGVGAQYKGSDYTISGGLGLNDKFDTLYAGYLRNFNSSTTLVAGLSHKLSTSETNVSMGAKVALENGASAKAAITNSGILSVQYAQELQKNTTLTFCSQIDTQKLDKSAKMGIQLNIK